MRFTIAFVEFGIDTDDVESIFMWDGDNTEVTIDNFGTIVKQYINCNNFIIRIGIKELVFSSLLAQVGYFFGYSSIGILALIMKCVYFLEPQDVFNRKWVQSVIQRRRAETK